MVLQGSTHFNQTELLKLNCIHISVVIVLNYCLGYV